MAYSDHFQLTDDLINHLDPIIVQLNNPFIESRYTGFLAVSSVTVLELAVKTIFIEFSSSKHKVFGHFCTAHFDRINGKIGLKNLKEDYVSKFGQKYYLRFERAVEKLEKHQLTAGGASVKASYGNLLTWRHNFAHQGNVPNHATFNEVKRAYGCGKQIIDCLASCMTR